MTIEIKHTSAGILIKKKKRNSWVCLIQDGKYSSFLSGYKIQSRKEFNLKEDAIRHSKLLCTMSDEELHLLYGVK